MSKKLIIGGVIGLAVLGCMCLGLIVALSPDSSPAEEDVPTLVATEVVEPTWTPVEVQLEEPDPTDVPTTAPTDVPTMVPTDTPTAVPTDAPTAVPTERPTSTPSPTEVPNTAAAEEYANEVIVELNILGSASITLGELMTQAGDNPYIIASDDWITSMAITILTLESAAGNLQDLDPPDDWPILVEVQGHLDKVANYTLLATERIVYGVDNIDADALDSGTNYFLLASDELNIVTEIVDEFNLTQN